MRSPPLAAVVLLALTGCASVPGFADPKTRIAAWALVYELGGDTSMQSDSGGPIVDNPPMDLERFGIQDQETGFGARLGVGDGFSGLEVDFTTIEDDGRNGGPLTENWGDMLAGDVVNTNIEMYDLRLRYIAGKTWQDEDEAWGAGLGFGAVLGHRELTMTVNEVNAARSQRIKMSDDGTLYFAARGRVSWTSFALTADFAISDDLNFGGEFSGTQQDLQVTLSYTLENGQMEVFAGYLYSAFPAVGRAGGLDFTTDFSLDGYFVGLAMNF